YTEEQRSIALAAMRDAIYNFIVDYTHTPHKWRGFMSNDTTTYSNVLYTPGGNRYGSPLTTIVYPKFLQSEAAIALRNRALGITPVAETTEDTINYDYETNTVLVKEDTIYPDLDMTLARK
ncbi:MAG: hypothetical protein K2J20_00915, partial [Bacilli bacterium]|nr:hypothetical protein [Bacilli bacterium]